MMELTSENFKSTIAKGNTVIDFWAPWCGPRRAMAPHFEEAAKNTKNVTFAKLNVDEHGQTAAEHKIMGIPALIFFKDGKEVSRMVGLQSKQAIEAKVKEAFR